MPKPGLEPPKRMRVIRTRSTAGARDEITRMTAQTTTMMMQSQLREMSLS